MLLPSHVASSKPRDPEFLLEASTSTDFLSSPMFPIDMTFQPPRVQRFVTLLPIKMHSVLKTGSNPSRYSVL